MVAYGLAIFSGAFLLFLAQPLLGKYVLPWFGGAPGVWTTCLLFFQLLLLAGYAYAHLSTRWLRPRAQALLHLGLLAAALATLPIIPNDSWEPHSADNPTLRIIGLLAASLGLPYFVLSATAPLLQHWFSRTQPGVSPFRLYALSNAGSLLALLAYPTLFEMCLTRTTQAFAWGIGLALYGIACALCARKLWNVQPTAAAVEQSAARVQGSESGAQAPIGADDRVLWLLLPACASVLLMAITHKICQDIAVIAFLWVLPLAVYLLSFIICFDRPHWYQRRVFGPALLAALVVMVATLTGYVAVSVPLQILVYAGGLLVCCMVCHGEVWRLKPDPAHLTSFYLMIAAGGALGGIFVGVVAPAIFTDFFELHWGLVLCGCLFLVVVARKRYSGKIQPRMLAAWGAGWVILAGLAGALWVEAHRFAEVRVHRSRNFYGVLNVYRHLYADPSLSQVELLHGRIVHGMQFLDPSRGKYPTLYFNPDSGIGRTFCTLPPEPRRVGIVGLGAGALAAYARRGDDFRFYEINPQVEQVAREYFTYLKDCPAELQVVPGDARLSLEREPSHDFDLLVLDAFNSDSIPIHLLTREAFEIYQRHLKTNGLVAVHVSNMSLNLEPVVLNLARQFGYQGVVLEQSQSNDRLGVLPSTWVVLTRSAGFADAPAVVEARRPPAPSSFKVPLWTDDFSSLFAVLKWKQFFGTESTRTAAAYVQAATALTNQAEVASAIAGFRAALNHEPDSAANLNNLACLLATASDPALRDGHEAVRLAERARSLTGSRSTPVLTTLAAAYAEAGRFEEAVKTAEQACALATANGEQNLLDRNRQLLELYRRNQAYHQAQ